jgi:hypothetical protein
MGIGHATDITARTPEPERHAASPRRVVRLAEVRRKRLACRLSADACRAAGRVGWESGQACNRLVSRVVLSLYQVGMHVHAVMRWVHA